MDGILKGLGIVPLDVLTQAIGFLILLFLVTKFGLNPLFAMLDKRRDEIKATYDQLDADRDAMHKTRAEYEQRLADIETQAREKIAAAVKEAQDLRANIIADAQKQAAATIEKGLADAERDRQRAFAEMRQQIVDIAILGAGKVINESLDNARHQKLVDDLIGTVGAAHLSGGAKATSNGAGPAAGSA